MAVDWSIGRRVWGALSVGWTLWVEEIEATFPRVSAWLAGDGATATIRADAQRTEVVVHRRTGSGLEVASSWPASITGLTDVQAAELGRFCTGCDVTVLMSSQAVHCMTTRLPKAAGVTTETVRYALLANAPLMSDKLLFDWQRLAPAGDPPATDWIDVNVVMCRRSSLDALAEGLTRCGVVATRIGVGAPDLATRLAFTLQRNKRSGAAWTSGLHRRLLLGSAGAIFVTGLLATGFWALWQERLIRSDLARLETQHREFASLAQRQSRLDAIKVELARTGIVPASTVLDEVAGLTPVDSWLLELRLDGGRLKAAGRSVNPTGLSSGFAQSRVIDNVRLDAVNANAGPEGTAGFELSATVRGTR